MFIGHFVAAEFLLKIDPTMPVLPVMVGVTYPDLLWGVLVLLNKESVHVEPKNPLQKVVRFLSYPYSHSLVRSAILTIAPSVLVGVLYHRAIVGVFFFLAALSHWLLDVVVHIHDLPVLGFGRDKKIGFALWNYPRMWFVAEYMLFALGTWAFVAPNHVLQLLVACGVLHLFNANAFFGFTKTNPTATPKRYAGLALFGFCLAATLFTWLLI